MKKRLQILIGIGVVFIFSVFIYWGNQTNHKLLSAISLEPTYQGETLSYWMAHWYQEYGHQNMEAEEAVRSMGTNALPYLVEWIGKPCRSSSDYDYCGRALKGFEVLGPTASPAIPDLIKIIGRNGNFPACALGYIGTNAIPALTKKLLELVAVTNEPPKPSFHFSDFFAGSKWPTEEFYVQRKMFCSLSFYGTNAQSAVPALISYLQNSNAKEPGDAVGILAMAGHNQPDIIIPVLLKTFSGSSGYVRTCAADALASFGTNVLSAIPVLLSGEQDNDANTRAHIAVAIKQIAPQTPNALDPIIHNLEHREACQQTLYILGMLGTNGVEALPALLKCLGDPDAQVRTDTARCLQKIDCFSDEIIIALGENISHANQFAAQEAEAALGQFASRSKLAFVTLIKKAICGGIGGQDLQQSKYYLINISRDDPKFMLECLDDSDAKVRLGALIVFYDLVRGVPEAIPKLRELATNDPDANVRSRAADVLQLQLQ
jgi:HEAT repeat protein